MLFNSLLIHFLVPELEILLLGKKIQQIQKKPKGNSLLITLKDKQNLIGLFFSADSQDYRIEVLSEEELGNLKDFQATNFFSYAVKGIIQKVSQVDFDRILKLSCQRETELKEVLQFDLIFELTGRNSNLILVNSENGTILDCLRKVTIHQNRYREILPGIVYFPPPALKKGNPLKSSLVEFMEILEGKNSDEIDSLLTKHFAGIDQFLTKEILLLSSISPNQILNEPDVTALWQNFQKILTELPQQVFLYFASDAVPPTILLSDFSFIPSSHKKEFPNLNSAIKEFFRIKKEKGLLSLEKDVFFKILQKQFKKLFERQKRLEKDWAEAEKFETYKRYGELLKTNLDKIERGANQVSLVDVFEPEPKNLKIPLNPLFSPQKNAQEYFKKYKKLKESLKIVHKRKKETDRFIDFIRKNLEELEQANTKEDWERIKVRINESLGDKKGETKKPKKKEEIHKPREYISSDGFTILVGKNNEENDYLTFQIAAPEDFWFHAQQVPGSHVVLKRKDKKNEPSKMAIEQTAQIAAYYSRARTSKKVPVIYTLAKYVKKARGSKPGLVVVSKEKSILVEPKLPTQP